MSHRDGLRSSSNTIGVDMTKKINYIAIVDCEIKKKEFKAGDPVNVQVPRWMVLQGLVLPEDKAKKLEEE